MVDESIVIEVKDSIDNSIAVKIKAIATEARSAFKDLGTLQKQLSALGVSKLGGVSSGANSAATATAKLATAQANLATATAKLQSAQNQAALSAQRLSDAQERAQKRSATATQAASAAATASSKLNKDLKNQATQFDKNGLSAKQYNAAMRGVPAQITDIVVSLQGGQKPLTVFLQQGGQLKDMFGGTVPAIKAMTRGLIAMINPLTIVAAGFAAFAYGASLVESRLRVINGLVTQFKATGRSDVDAGTVENLRKELALLPGISKSVATEVIKNFAEVRNVGGKILKEASLTVVDLAASLGIDAPEASKKLAEALNDPLKGAQDLDKSLGFLTTQDFKTIKSLTELGKTAQAQQLLLDKLKGAIGGLTNEGLTPMQKATNDLGNAWSNFTTKLGESDIFKAVLDGLTGMVTGLTWIVGKLDTLFSMKPPAWLTTALLSAAGGAVIAGPVGAIAGGVAGGVGGAIASAMQGTTNTGGATGSWDTPRTAEQLKPTKLKTDAAGITGTKNKTGESRATALKKINLQLTDELRLQNMLGDSREKEEMFNRINEGLVGRNIKLLPKEEKVIRGKIAAIVEGALAASEAMRIDEEYNGVQKQFNATMTSANKLFDNGTITLEQYNRASLLAQETIANAQDPLRQYNKELDNQFSLTKLTNKETEIETYMQGISNDLLAKGIDLKTTDNKTILDGVEALRKRKIELQANAEIQSSVNRINDETIGALNKLKVETEALSIAHKEGMLTADQYSLRLVKLGVDAANIRLKMGTGTFDDMALSSIGTLITSYEGMLAGLSTSFGSFFQTLNAGFGDSIGRAIVYSEDLGTAIQDVAKNALSQLISSLVQLGVQYVVNAALGQSVAATTLATTTAASVAAAGVTAAAWAPAATMTSLASFGANSAPAMTGISATAALSESLALASVAGYEHGGYTGNMATDAVAGVVHGQEFVMNAEATRENRPMLEAMNRGANSAGGSTVGTSARTGGINVTIENYGADIETKQISENEMVIIARRVAKETVARDTPDVMAGAVRNPNSTYSKSLGASTNTQRRRN